MKISMVKIIIFCCMAVLFITGCVAMYTPIVWDRREEVYQLIDSDPLLSALYSRFDPNKITLHGPYGYDELILPSELTSHMASFDDVNNLIYVNREINFSEAQLKKILIHEFSHYVWNTGLDSSKKTEWKEYLRNHPSPLQRLVALYYPPNRHDIENFAFTIEFPRTEDIKKLVTLSILSESEANAVLSKMKAEPKPDYWGVGMFDLGTKRRLMQK